MPMRGGVRQLLAAKAKRCKEESGNDYNIKSIDIAGDVDGTTFRLGMLHPTNIGPLITSYLTERPKELKTCGMPCPGPRGVCGRQRPPAFTGGREFCVCDGNGFCRLSSDLGRFRTLRCTCKAGCLDKPPAKWRENAWVVLLVICKCT